VVVVEAVIHGSKATVVVGGRITLAIVGGAIVAAITEGNNTSGGLTVV
jgi:hypothetical protein